MKHFDTPEQEKMVKEAIQNVVDLHNARGYLGGSQPFYKYSPDVNEAIHLLSNRDVAIRKSALVWFLYHARTPSAEPILFRIATTDPSLDARTLATQIINNWEDDHFIALEPAQIQRWW
jgi:hypothetical protein